MVTIGRGVLQVFRLIDLDWYRCKLESQSHVESGKSRHYYLFTGILYFPFSVHGCACGCSSAMVLVAVAAATGL